MCAAVWVMCVNGGGGGGGWDVCGAVGWERGGGEGGAEVSKATEGEVRQAGLEK